LVSKVKALLRRLRDEDKNEQKLKIGKLIIDREEYKVTFDGKIFSLPRKEFELLFLLASKQEKVIKREKIMEIIWGSEVVVGDRTIDVHIRKLREKIGDKYFKTVKGVGYKFVPLNL
jgi:two-component system alkaline phosphatase synthesis response regulator PhoP